MPANGLGAGLPFQQKRGDWLGRFLRANAVQDLRFGVAPGTDNEVNDALNPLVVTDRADYTGNNCVTFTTANSGVVNAGIDVNYGHMPFHFSGWVDFTTGTIYSKYTNASIKSFLLRFEGNGNLMLFASENGSSLPSLSVVKANLPASGFHYLDISKVLDVATVQVGGADVAFTSSLKSFIFPSQHAAMLGGAVSGSAQLDGRMVDASIYEGNYSLSEGAGLISYSSRSIKFGRVEEHIYSSAGESFVRIGSTEYADINSAVLAAIAGDVILVGDGDYLLPTNANVDIPDEVTIRGHLPLYADGEFSANGTKIILSSGYTFGSINDSSIFDSLGIIATEQAGIRLGTGSSNCIVTNCIVDGLDQVDHGMLCLGDLNYVHNNSFYRIEFHGVAIKGQRHTIAHNLIYGGEFSALIVKADIGESASNKTTDCVVAHNTIFDPKNSSGIFIAAHEANSEISNVHFAYNRCEGLDDRMDFGVKMRAEQAGSIIKDVYFNNNWFGFGDWKYFTYSVTPTSSVTVNLGDFYSNDVAIGNGGSSGPGTINITVNKIDDFTDQSIRRDLDIENTTEGTVWGQTQDVIPLHIERGVSVYEHGSSDPLYIAYDTAGDPVSITPPTGYTKTSDNPGGVAHNNAESTILETDTVNGDLLERAPWSDDGLTFDARTLAFINTQLSGTDGVWFGYAPGTCRLVRATTLRKGKVLTMAEYRGMVANYPQGSCGGGVIPFFEWVPLVDPDGNILIDDSGNELGYYIQPGTRNVVNGVFNVINGTDNVIHTEE